MDIIPLFFFPHVIFFFLLFVHVNSSGGSGLRLDARISHETAVRLLAGASKLELAIFLGHSLVSLQTLGDFIVVAAFSSSSSVAFQSSIPLNSPFSLTFPMCSPILHFACTRTLTHPYTCNSSAETAMPMPKC